MSSTEKIVLTGIKPTGTPHVGNYVGALKPLIEQSQTQKTFMFIADLHALNLIHDASLIKQHTYEITAMLVALVVRFAKKHVQTVQLKSKEMLLQSTMNFVMDAVFAKASAPEKSSGLHVHRVKTV